MDTPRRYGADAAARAGRWAHEAAQERLDIDLVLHEALQMTALETACVAYMLAEMVGGMIRGLGGDNSQAIADRILVQIMGQFAGEDE